jgi:hypothetical protein
MSSIAALSRGTSRAIRSIKELTSREKRRLVSEISQVSGLMPLLMKPRNRQKWSREDKAQLAVHIKRLSAMSPYLVVLLMPGGLLALPALAWWLDRRRTRNRAPAADT